MRKFIAALALAGIGVFALAPAANAVLLSVPVLDVQVKVLEPSAPLVDVNVVGDVKVLPTLPVLSDPLVHVCVNGVVQSVLASVAVNLHLDVLGSDADCHPLTTPPTTTPPSPGDPLVHVCVNGTVNSVLASVAANLHLDVLGSDDNCPAPGGPVTPPPPGTDDPLVHVCVNGVVQTKLLSVALNLHLDVLGSDNKCPPVTKPPVTEPPVVKPPVTNPPGTNPPPGTTTVTPGNTDVPVTVSTPAPVAAKPAAKKNTGPLAFTGNGWVQLLAGIGVVALIAGLLFKYLGKK